MGNNGRIGRRSGRDASDGAYRGSCDLTFPGDVDEVGVWSATLGASDIRSQLANLLAVWGF